MVLTLIIPVCLNKNLIGLTCSSDQYKLILHGEQFSANIDIGIFKNGNFEEILISISTKSRPIFYKNIILIKLRGLHSWIGKHS